MQVLLLLLTLQETHVMTVRHCSVNGLSPGGKGKIPGACPNLTLLTSSDRSLDYPPFSVRLSEFFYIPFCIFCQCCLCSNV